MGRGVLWGVVVALGMPAVALLATAMPATAFGCQYLETEFIVPYPRDERVEHLALDGAVYVDGEYLHALADIRTPDGAPVTWEYAPLDDAPVFAATPTNGWEVGEYVLWEYDAPVGPVYEVRNAVDPTPPRFEVLGWSGQSPTDRPTSNCGGSRERAVRLDLDRPNEPVIWLWEVWDGDELLDAGHERDLHAVPAPDHAVDIHLTAIDLAGNRTTQVLEGAVGCTGCRGSHSPQSPAAWGLLTAVLGLLGRRRRLC